MTTNLPTISQNGPTVSKKEPTAVTSPTSQSAPNMSQIVHLPGVSVLRNPILGESYKLTRSNYPWLNNRRSRIASTSQTEHERSVFTSTGMVRSFYIIHPDWNSEVSGHRRLRATCEPRAQTQRIQASLSAQDALRENLIPLLQKKAKLSRPLPEGLSVYLLGVRDGYKQARAIGY